MKFRFARMTLVSCFFVCSLGQASQVDKKLARKIIHDLKESIQEDTTSLRQEFRSIVHQKFFRPTHEILMNGTKVDEQSLLFNLRDKPFHQGKNSTFTFYGKKVHFQNGDIKTSIKLRARFYLQYRQDGSLNLSSTMWNGVFLELKIKNPEEHLENVINKYRVRISEEDLITLFSLDSQRTDFDEKMDQIEESVKKYPSNKKRQNLIPSFFNAIRQFAKMEADFIKPELGIYYERLAFQYTENPYISVNSEKCEDYGKIDYQFTVDKKIQGYFSQPIFYSNFSFIDYFRFGLDVKEAVEYPEDSLVIEAKIPLRVAQLDEKERSSIHRFLNEEFINKMRKNAIQGEFIKSNGGKSAYLRKASESED